MAIAIAMVALSASGLNHLLHFSHAGGFIAEGMTNPRHDPAAAARNPPSAAIDHPFYDEGEMDDERQPPRGH
jgi:hypothetical protein